MLHYIKVNLSYFLSALLISIFTVHSLNAQDAPKKQLTAKDYGQWETLGFNSFFSDNGNWFVYDIRRNNDKNELRLHNVSDNSDRILPEGSRAQFSNDSNWLAYFINPTAAETKKSKKPLRSEFTLLDLSGSDSLTIKNVTSFAFSDNSRFLALKHFAAEKKKSKGSDLIIRDLSTEKEYNFGNVSEFAWQDEGTLLAMIIDADDKAGNGVQLFDVNSGVLRILDSENSTYSGLVWREKSDDLAAFRVKKNEAYEDDTNHILAWSKLSTKKSESFVFDQESINGFPEDNKVVSNRRLAWSDNGNSLFFAIKEWEKKPESSESEDKDTEDLTKEAPALQIWHSKDVQVIPAQKQLADRRREDQFLSVWHLADKKFIQLANDLTETIRLQTDVSMLVGYDRTPYEKEGMFGRGSQDAYLINIMTGDSKKILTDINYIYNVSPDGRYVPYVQGKDFYVYDEKSGTTKVVSEDLTASFINLDDDHPTPNKRPYGFISWEKAGTSFFVNSKYDIWQLWADGSKTRKITDGEANQTRHRFTYLDFEDYIDAKEPMYLSLFGEWTKKSGYASVIPGKNVSNLVWEDARVSRLTKAEDTDRFGFSSETFSDSPDFFIASKDFKTINQISNTNSFQQEYHWGKSELIEYTNANGKELQGALFYPANYDPNKKYPMITYIYERLSDGIHSYGTPSQRNYYSHGVFTQEGYFVLRPDIVFDAGDPGISSVRTMEAAVKKVVDMGLIDEKKVGLIGHSWGGYQAGYAVTQTDIFSASVAGAGLTNLTSMYGMIAWAFGGAPESAHFEVSQERMVVPPYEDIDGYIRNSSVFNVDKLNTPLLFEVGDDDKNVDWRQGIEYYNAARRADKQFVLLVYANEGHGLRQDKNRADYQMRILKWFGHYLKGESAESWINQGIPYEAQMKTLKNWKK